MRPTIIILIGLLLTIGIFGPLRGCEKLSEWLARRAAEQAPTLDPPEGFDHGDSIQTQRIELEECRDPELLYRDPAGPISKAMAIAQIASIEIPVGLDSARVYSWDGSYGNRLDIWTQLEQPGQFRVWQPAREGLPRKDCSNGTEGAPQEWGYRLWLGEIPDFDRPILIACDSDTLIWGHDAAPAMPSFAMRDSIWMDLSFISTISVGIYQHWDQQISPDTGLRTAMIPGWKLTMEPNNPPSGWKTHEADLYAQTIAWRERWNQ